MIERTPPGGQPSQFTEMKNGPRFSRAAQEKGNTVPQTHTVPEIGSVFADDSPRARATDPETSHEAADSNDLAGSSAEAFAIIDWFGPMDDFQLVEYNELRAARSRNVAQYTPQRLRSARAALVKDGRIEFTGMFHISPTGRRTRVWQVAS